MALGAATRSAGESGQGERLFVDVLTFAGDSSYPTGGTDGFDAYVQAVLGDARNVVGVVMIGDCGDNIPIYVGGKLMVKVLSTGLEVANAVDLSGVTFTVMVISK